jgi:hypothetical protein
MVGTDVLEEDAASIFKTDVIRVGKWKYCRGKVKGSDQGHTDDFYPETSVTTYKITQRHNPEDKNPNSRHREILNY